jgi:hypothetical protein
MDRDGGEEGARLPNIVDAIEQESLPERQVGDGVLAPLARLGRDPVVLVTGSTRRYVLFSYDEFHRIREELLDRIDDAVLRALAITSAREGTGLRRRGSRPHGRDSRAAQAA